LAADSPVARPTPGDVLTQREVEVVRLMAEGLRYKEIAGRLFVSLNTVRFHAKSIYSKLGVNNRTHALVRARELHVI
jgi:LuxR family maltose regulon positive regulatory protein